MIRQFDDKLLPYECGVGLRSEMNEFFRRMMD